MLALQGIPLAVRGFDEVSTSHLLRLRLPVEAPSNDVDVALVRSTEDAQTALDNKFRGAVVISDKETAVAPEEGVFSRVVRLPDSFAYS